MTTDIGEKRSAPARSRRRGRSLHGEEGVSLVIALAAMVLLSVVAAAVAMFAQVSISASRVYREQRDDRYAGDAAINAAINWASEEVKTGIDVELGDPDRIPCVYRVPGDNGNPDITVTCDPEPGSGSGTPVDTGLTPDQAIVILGQRYGESDLLSPCTANEDKNRNPEVGILFNNATPVRDSERCSRQAGGIKEVFVEGDILSNSPIHLNQGSLIVGDGGTVTAGTSNRFSNLPCDGSVIPTCAALGTAQPRNAPDGPANSPWDPREFLVEDPRAAAPHEWPRGEIVWDRGRASVNGGDPMEVTLGNVNGSGGLIEQCAAVPSGHPRVVRFYPGWFDDAKALNDLFNAGACNDAGLGRFWFQPSPGDIDDNPDEEPMTEHAKQGVYLFDFRNTGGGQACGNYENDDNLHRLCLADFGANGPFIVGGWPKNWDPAAIEGVGPTPGERSYVAMTTATRIEGAFLSGWLNQSGARTIGDGSVAKYDTFLPSFTNRRLTLGDFSPQVASGASNRHVRVTVRHRETGNARVGEVWMRLRSKERDGRTIDCGNFLVSRTGGDWVEDVIDTSEDDYPAADRQRLQACMATADRANNIEVNWHLEGVWNSWSGAVAELDGVKIEIEVSPHDWFDDELELDRHGIVYCDPDKPGVQFIIGGDSQIHAAGSTLHLCAGPADEDPQQYQQIALWGEPGQTSLKARKVHQALHEGTCCNNAQGTYRDLEHGAVAAKPYWQSPLAVPTTKFDFSNSGLLPPYSRSMSAVWADFDKVDVMEGCDPVTTVCLDPTTQRVVKVELKVAADTNCPELPSWIKRIVPAEWDKGVCDSGSDPEYFVYDAARREKRYQAGGSVGACAGNMNPTRDVVWQIRDITPCMRLGPDGTDLSVLNDMSVQWNARCAAFCGDFVDRVAGVELIVTIGPREPGSRTVLSATGCRNGSQGYGAGTGRPHAQDLWMSQRDGSDCAVLSGGRISVLGTIYAPTDAIEIADGSALYPFASRGLVARHLRVRGYKQDPRYEGQPTITNEINPEPQSRDMVFVACKREVATEEPCGDKAGDQVLSQARVVFTAERVPHIEWWETRR